MARLNISRRERVDYGMEGMAANFRRGITMLLKMGYKGVRTQADLARKTEFSPGLISDLVSGRSTASYDTYERISEAFNLTIDVISGLGNHELTEMIKTVKEIKSIGERIGIDA